MTDRDLKFFDGTSATMEVMKANNNVATEEVNIKIKTEPENDSSELNCNDFHDSKGGLKMEIKSELDYKFENSSFQKHEHMDVKLEPCLNQSLTNYEQDLNMRRDNSILCVVSKESAKLIKNSINILSNSHLSPAYFECAHCDFSFNKKSQLRSHIASVHLEKLFVCCYCDYRGATKKILRSHTFKDHDERNSLPLSSQKAHLKKLSKTFDKHRGKSSANIRKPHGCSRCDYTTYQKSSISRHFNAIHQHMRPHQCPDCDYRATQKKNLVNHIRATHKGEKPFKCPHCSYGTIHKNDVTRHVSAIHKGEKPFQCTVCDYRATQKSCVLRHISAIHKREKPFHCSFCDYKASRKDCIVLHTNAVHKKEKPFQCSQCDYRATQKTLLINHIWSNHFKGKPLRAQNKNKVEL